MGVPDDEAIRAGRELAATEGLLAVSYTHLVKVH